jgi:hypothetical protein
MGGRPVVHFKAGSTGSPEARVVRLFVIIVLAAAPALADDVYLRGGAQITGQIVDQTEDSVTVDIGGGTITAQMSSVVRIEKNTSPLQEFRTRAAGIAAGDAEAWRQLARWANGYSLSSQAREAYREVLKILPDDEEANTATGMVRLDGKWVTEEESYRAQGYVQFEGKWMTPAEQQSIIAGRQAQQAQAEADRKANEAKVASIEAEQQAEQKRQEEERAKLDANSNTVYWGWGAGPRYWYKPTRPWPENPATRGQ